MTTTTTALTGVPISGRRIQLGGFSLTLVGMELRRMLRNRRTVTFTLILPSVLFLLFGAANGYRNETAGYGNVSAYVLVSIAVYGAMLATITAGAAVSIERANGWSRQLRLTPLHPLAYVTVKVVAAMTLGAASVLVVFAVGAVSHAEMPLRIWIETGLLAWLCSLVFAAFGLFLGYLLPTENVMQIIGAVMGILSFVGGLFVPVDQLGKSFAMIAVWTPVYGVGEIARYPLVHEGSLGIALVNVIAWAALFTTGAALLFRRDTARV